MKNLFVYSILLFSCTTFAQPSQPSSTQSQGGSIKEEGIYRTISIVGQAASNSGYLENTGYSGSIGFLTFDNAINTAPVADAGADQELVEGANVMLDGTASYDPQNDTLSYQWESLDGAMLSNASSPQPSFLISDVQAKRKYRFRLRVSDGELFSDYDTVTIVISDPTWVPVTHTNSSTLYGVVTLNDIPADECDYVATFVSGECRGAQEVLLYQGQAYVVFNLQSESPETVNFKVYDYSENKICQADIAVMTNPGGDIGSPGTPIMINGICNSLTAAFTLSASSVCAGELVNIQFSGSFTGQPGFHWDFAGGNIQSGSNEGPFGVYWENSGMKEISLYLEENGEISNIYSRMLEIFPSGDTTYIEITTCNLDGEATVVDLLLNSNGCDSLVITSLVYEPIEYAFNLSPVSCNGEQNGAVEISYPGNLSFNWANGSDGSLQTNLDAGAYFVTITNEENGCSVTDSVQITEPPPLSIVITGNDDYCGNGFVMADIEGGIGIYQILWNTGDTTQFLSGTREGTFSAMVTDGNGCTVETSFQIEDIPPLVTITEIIEEPGCGAANGIAQVNISGGQTPYQVMWSNGDTLAQATNLPAGAFQVTVTDVAGCTNVETVNIFPSNFPYVSGVEVTDYFCGVGGAIDISVTGGAPPYQYGWSNGETSEDIVGLSAGMYGVTATDQNNCQAVFENISIENLGEELEIGFDQQPCVIEAVPFNGAPPYTYLWNSGALGSQITGLIVGQEYAVTITDLNGCTIDTITTAQSGIADAEFLMQRDGLTVNFVSSPGSIFEYWSFGDGNELLGISPTHTYASGGSYLVSHITYNSCGSDTTNTVINLPNVTIPDYERINDFTVVPNPTNGMIRVSANFETEVKGSVKVFNSLEQLVFSHNFYSAEMKIDIDLSNLSDGLYILILQEGDQIIKRKIIKATP